jgi:hypothetical protein
MRLAPRERGRTNKRCRQVNALKEELAIVNGQQRHVQGD